MIFGRTRKRAREAAIAAMRPVISANQISGGLSTAMYFDPYVLGYLSTIASLIIKFELRGKASAEDVGLAMQHAFTQVCNVNGVEASRRMIELAENRDPDFARGADEAAISILYAYQLLRDEADEPIVQEAEQLAQAMGGPLMGGDHRSAVGGAIMMNTFNRHVRELRADAVGA